jgi:hypothetical protein
MLKRLLAIDPLSELEGVVFAGWWPSKERVTLMDPEREEVSE